MVNVRIISMMCGSFMKSNLKGFKYLIMLRTFHLTESSYLSDVGIRLSCTLKKIRLVTAFE